jgi:serine/threonine protein kinase
MYNTNDNNYPTLEEYILVSTLGSGYNSKVKLGFNTKTEQYHAVKIIKHDHPKLNLENLQKEIEILSHLNHSNIVNLIKYYECAEYTKKSGKTYNAIAIIMEVVTNGELFEYLVKSGRFSEKMARTYFKILIETLEYCHEKGVAHRDLKPENLLLDDDFNLKIADFGFSTLLSGKNNTAQLYTILGTETYMAPELHLRQPYSGASIDLFAAGIILFNMISGTAPFQKAHPTGDSRYRLLCINDHNQFWTSHELNVQKQTGHQTQFFSDDLKDMLNSLFAYDPVLRMTISELKSHPWFQGDTVTFEELKSEFNERKKKVDFEMQKLKEAKQAKNLMVKETNKNNYSGGVDGGGFKPYRDFEDMVGGNIQKKVGSKVNFDAQRNLLPLQPKAGFKAFSRIYSIHSPDFLLKYIYSILATGSNSFEIKKDQYKLKGRFLEDTGSCKVTISI